MQEQTIRLLGSILLASLFSLKSFGQCEVEATASVDTSVCGDCVTLTAFGEGQGLQVFQENFDSGNPTGWAFTQQATFTNPCSPNGVDGTTHIWMGNQSAVPRALETVSYDLTSATAGVTICFDMLFAEQGANAPCEGPDEPDEGVYLQYSTDGGNTWNTINYFDPNGGNDPDLVNWNNWCFTVPQAAITPNTSFRWFQDNDSGADFDHWGIDNVNIYYNDPTYNITWTHDNYSYGVGSSGGDNPTPVCPNSTSVYYVEMTNGNFTCTDSVQINVIVPNLEVDAGNDTTVCNNNCAQLNGTAKVIKRPAKTPTYENNEFEAIAAGFGQTTSININVTGLNMTNILPGSITEVCINNLNFFGVNIFPPGQSTLGDLEIYLNCPDGTQILLIPSGVTTSSSPLDGYNNTCFTPVSVNDIANSSPNYTGDFMPNQPLDNLAGCTANGIWSIEIVSTTQLGFGAGTFNGWSISFDDPEISYEADYSWTPTASLTNPNTQSPIACPTSDQEYILTASDSVGCVTLSDTVLVEVDSVCCNLDLSASLQQPSCGNSDGSITLNITQGSGNYSITWSNQATTSSVNNLSAGVYSVTVEDLDVTGCTIDTSFVLSNPGAATIDTLIVTNETCLGDNDGSIAVVVSGGTPPYSYSWNIISSDSSLTGLAAGNYTVTVTDNNNCNVSAAVTIVPGPDCCNISLDLSATNPDCGQSSGSITATPQNGSGTYSYTWNPQAQGNSLSNLGAGLYQLTVEDLGRPNCFIDTSITLSGVLNTGLTVDTAICEGEQLVYNGAVFDSAGTYTVIVGSGQGCDTIVTLNLSNIPVLGSAPESDFFNTATDGNGATLSIGSNDLNWEVAENDSSGPYSPTIVMVPDGNYYNSPWPDASWISHSQSGSHSGNVDYFYRIDFELPCQDSCGRSYVDSNVLCIGLDFFADNSVQEIYLNGVPKSSQIPGVPTLINPYNHQGYIQSNIVSVSLCDGWKPGTNTLILKVVSGGPFAGFLAQTSVTIPPFTEPYDTLDRYICEFDTITVNGLDIYQAGSYPFELNTSSGCDSNVVLNVFVNQNTSSFISDTICTGSQFEFNGNFYSQAGTYIDTLQNSAGCDSIVTLELNVNDVLSSNFNATICIGEEYELNGNFYDQQGTYYDTLVGLSGCDSVVILNLSIGDSILVDAGDDTLIVIGNNAQLQGSINNSTSPSGQYFWSPSFLLSCDDCLNPIATLDQDQVFVLSYSDTNNCSGLDSVLVEVTDLTYAIPNAFTPNGAGVNSQFDIISQGGAVVKQFQIFNRWGELVHNSTTPWDGTYNGKDQPVGTYVYYFVIELENGDEVKETGEISLIR